MSDLKFRPPHTAATISPGIAPKDEMTSTSTERTTFQLRKKMLDATISVPPAAPKVSRMPSFTGVGRLRRRTIDAAGKPITNRPVSVHAIPVSHSEAFGLTWTEDEPSLNWNAKTESQS